VQEGGCVKSRRGAERAQRAYIYYAAAVSPPLPRAAKRTNNERTPITTDDIRMKRLLY
jgi:hypothetical protein